MIKLQSHIKVGNLVVVYAAVLHLPQWYVATADGILIFGPFSSLEEAMEAARGTTPQTPRRKNVQHSWLLNLGTIRSRLGLFFRPGARRALPFGDFHSFFKA